MTTWHWVRHGPTHEKTFVGWRDVPADLSDHAAICRLNDHLPDNALLISSDLSRAAATADVLSSVNRYRLPHSADLRELDFGTWDGKHFSEVAATDPELSRAYWETPGDIVAPKGESWNQAERRISTAVDQLTAENPDRHIIAVAHFGTILTQLQRALRMSPAKVLAYKIDNLSVTQLIFDDAGWHAQSINHCP